jgi:hypothetical protein
MDRIIHAACGTVEVAFKDLFLIFLIRTKRKISFTDWAAENVHQ